MHRAYILATFLRSLTSQAVHILALRDDDQPEEELVHYDREAFCFTKSAEPPYYDLDIASRPVRALIAIGIPGAMVIATATGQLILYSYVAASALRVRLQPPISAPPERPGRSKLAGRAAFFDLESALFETMPQFDAQYEPVSLLSSRDAGDVVPRITVGSSIRIAVGDGTGRIVTVGQSTSGVYQALGWTCEPQGASLVLWPIQRGGTPVIATSAAADLVSAANLLHDTVLFGFRDGSVGASQLTGGSATPFLRVHAGAVTAVGLYDSDGSVLGGASASMDGTVALLSVGFERVTLVGRIVVGTSCTALAVTDGYLAIGTADGAVHTVSFLALYSAPRFLHLSQLEHNTARVSQSAITELSASANGHVLVVSAHGQVQRAFVSTAGAGGLRRLLGQGEAVP